MRNDQPRESSERRYLVRAWGSILVWAADASVVNLRFFCCGRQSFSFTYADGSGSSDCDNVAEPPEDLRIPLYQSLLREAAWGWAEYKLLKIKIDRYGFCPTTKVIVVGWESTRSWNVKFVHGSIECALSNESQQSLAEQTKE